MTANPELLEIKITLLPEQKTTDRPDLVAYVFRLKSQALLQDIVHDNVLGQIVAHVYTIEFQKRGLPHMHFLLKTNTKLWM